MSGDLSLAEPRTYHPDMVRLHAWAATVVLVASIVTGCGPPAVAPSGAVVGPTQAIPTGSTPAAPSLDIEQPGLTPSTGQSDTDWGPIWDVLPPGFPEPPGGEPAEADSGPVSAAWTVPKSALANPRDVAQFYVDQFSAVGYGGGRDGPLEDRSYTAWASNGYGCDILVTAVPRGAEETFVTVLYGAGCPFSWPASE